MPKDWEQPEAFELADENVKAFFQALADEFNTYDEIVIKGRPEKEEASRYSHDWPGWSINFGGDLDYARGSGWAPDALADRIADLEKDALLYYLREMEEDDPRKEIADEIRDGPRDAELDYARQYHGLDKAQATARFTQARMDLLFVEWTEVEPDLTTGGTTTRHHARPLDPSDNDTWEDYYEFERGWFENESYYYELDARYDPDDMLIRLVASFDGSGSYTSHALPIASINVLPEAFTPALTGNLVRWAINAFQSV